MFSFIKAIAIVFCVLASLQAQPDNSSIESRIAELEQRCLQQQSVIQELEQQSQHFSPEYTQKIVQEYIKQNQAQEDEAGVVAGYEDGFFIRNNDSSFELKLSGFMQMGVGFFERDSFDKNSFFAQGLYLMFDVNFLEKFHVHIEADFADTGNWDQFQTEPGLDFALYDAYLEYSFSDKFNVLIGNVYVPFTMTGTHYYHENPMIWYEPFVNSIAHGNDVGIMFYGTFNDQWEYTLGIFNGNGTGLDNNDDAMAMAKFRWYFLGQEENPETFVHFAAITWGMDAHSSQDELGAVLYSGWGRQVYDGNGQNPHADKYSSGRVSESLTNGWKYALDLAFRWNHNFENKSNLNAEVEIMYTHFQRKLTTGKLAPLHCWGALFTIAYRYPLCKDVEDSGIIPSFAFSYTDLDNAQTRQTSYPGGPEANIKGQTIFNYTIGLGYAFNAHAKINFNWIMMDLSNPKVVPAKDRAKLKEHLEHAFFVQTTLAW